METKELKVTITGGSPLGMRIKGGLEYSSPITIENVTPNSKAFLAGIQVGDIITAINGVSVTGKIHNRVKEMLTDAKDILNLDLKRGSVILDQKKTSEQDLSNLPKPVDITSSSVYKQTPYPEKKVSEPKSAAGNYSSAQTSNIDNPPTKTNVALVGREESWTVIKDSENGKSKQPQTEETDKISKPIGYCGLCLKCKQKIGTNNYIKIGDRVWHGDHFECSVCNKNLASIGFFEDKDKILCKECFGDIVSPKCGECGKPCIEKYVTASARSYHTECFTCKKCHTELNGKPFNIHDGHPHCMDCISNILSIKCFKCEKPILPNNEYVESMNKQYHSSCFKCSICSADLSGQGKYYIKEGKPCCSHHN